jgi:DNA repair protein RecN (Recombination protein N)
MLRELRIENFVLFTDCTVQFDEGLNILTGETGAGKSLLLDALGLVLGARANSALIRASETMAQVTARFMLSPTHPVAAWLEEHAIAPEDGMLIIRRQIRADGRSKAFINDVAVTQASLKDVGDMLVEIHGQHDQRGLLDPKNHRDVLDMAAAAMPTRSALARAYHAWKAANARFESCDAAIAQALREEAYLRHIVSELDRLNPQPNEETDLIERRSHAQAYKKSRDALASMQQLLSGGQSPLSQLVQCEKILARTGLPDETQQGLAESMARASSELMELDAQLEALAREADRADIDTGADDRLHALRDAARKYRTTVDGLAEMHAEAKQTLEQVSNQQALLESARASVEETKATYLAHAGQLSALRAKHADRLCTAICNELAALKMAATQMRMRIAPLEEHAWSEAGTEQVQFEVATNKGAPFGGLHKVASGGELSRVLLAMKVVLGEKHQTSTAIFDEIDTGTGGATAEAIGKRLKLLSEGSQVLVVTHLAQIASMADTHLKIEKSDQGEQTETRIYPLRVAEREEELARMISGEEITPEAKRAAKKMRKVATQA